MNVITFKDGKCPCCGRVRPLMISNNPLSGPTICFDCIKSKLDQFNLAHADFFCRTYNLPFDPEKWIGTNEAFGEETFENYTILMLEEKDNQPNLAYSPSTKDLWSSVNKEWEKHRSLATVMKKLPLIQDSFETRERLKWGAQYSFEELLKIESLYTRTLRANNITNPMQKEAVKTLCKLQVEIDEAIRLKDTKAIKEFSSAWATFAKQADLETMINETKTEDITTVAELYDFMEKSGFQLKFYDNFARDEVDRTIDDLKEANRRLVLESTGLQAQLEEMIKKRQETEERKKTSEATQDVSLDDLLNFHPEDQEIEMEDDSDALSETFNEEEIDNFGKDVVEIDEFDDKTKVVFKDTNKH